MLRLLRADVGIRPYILCRQIVGYRRGSVILLLPEEAPEKRPGEAFCCLNGWLYKTVFSCIYQAFLHFVVLHKNMYTCFCIMPYCLFPIISICFNYAIYMYNGECLVISFLQQLNICIFFICLHLQDTCFLGTTSISCVLVFLFIDLL